jgi:HAD superfamily hydrolase (TIGR01509 family)
VFDWGGVVSFHCCEPWQENLSRLLNTSPNTVKNLLSEFGELGRDYRLGKISRDEFWASVIKEAGSPSADPSELEFNWAMSYQIDNRMVELLKQLKNEQGCQLGLLSNSDEYRQKHNETMYKLSKIFDFIIGPHNYEVMKPNLDAYQKVLEIAGRTTNPNKVICVDDKECNVIPLQKLGIQGYTFSNYGDFVKLLKENKIISE